MPTSEQTQPIWEEAPRGDFPDPSMLGLSGFDQIAGYPKGFMPRPPISHLIGTFPAELEPGVVGFVMPASGWLLSSTGLIPLGILATVADGALGCSVQVTLPPATPYATAELTLTGLRPAPVGEMLHARGSIIHSGRQMALSEMRLEDPAGRLLAHGTSRCTIFPPLDPAPEPPEPQPVVLPTYDTPDPYEREPRGAVLPQEVWDRLSGLEVMQAQLAGELEEPPLHHLTGLTLSEAGEGTAEFRLPCTKWLTSPLGTVQGGFTAMIADAALQCAIMTTLPAGTAFASADLKVNYLRPVQADGRDLVARGTVAHRGRSIAIGNAEVLDADGKRVALATGSALVLPGRPADLSS